MARLKVRYYVEKPGGTGEPPRRYWQPSAALAKLGWKPERLDPDRTLAIARAETLNARVDAWRRGEATADTPPPPVDSSVKAGTVAACAEIWQASDAWDNLAPKTRRSYRDCLKHLLAFCGDAPPRAITAKRAVKFYEGLHRTKPATAAAVVRVARVLWKTCRREGLADGNPWRDDEGGPRIEGSGEQAGRLWSARAIALMVKTADTPDPETDQTWSSVGTAILINSWFGQRLADILTLPRALYRDGVIQITQRKTRARVELPIGMVAELTTRLEAELSRQRDRKVTSCTTLLVCEGSRSDSGRPWTTDYFAHVFAALRVRAVKAAGDAGDVELAAELAELQFMHLRHTAITRLAEAGCTSQEIAAITGHTLAYCTSIIDRYMVRTAGMARTAFAKRLKHEGEKG